MGNNLEPKNRKELEKQVISNKDDAEDLVWISRVYRESIGNLDRLSRRVDEGQDLYAALGFAQWLLWSGLIPLCRRHAREQPKIDGAFLEWKAEELQRAVRAKFNNPKAESQIAATQLEQISRKLDVLAAAMARCSARCGP